MFALGATLLLSGSTAAISATPHTLSRYCAVDLKSLCADVKPGEGAFKRAYSRISAHSLWAARQGFRGPPGWQKSAMRISSNSAPTPSMGTLQAAWSRILARSAIPAKERSRSSPPPPAIGDA